ncbi:MAG TPA: S8 family serine peptidase [Candidatus Methanoperedens sp.]
MNKTILALLTITIVTALIAPAIAKPAMTLPHRSTWDSDMVDVNQVHAEGYTGKGVYIAVLDTGLVPNWRDYFPEERIETKLGKGFREPVYVDPKTGKLVEAGLVEETSWIGSTLSSHGTHVTSTILGYNYYAPADSAAGLPLQPLFVEGIAPGAMVIPVKVLTTYSLPHYTEPDGVVFGTDKAVAAGIDYATELKLKGYSPMVISMSLGDIRPSDVIENAIDHAIENGVIVVAAAGNDGTAGMDWPGAYPQVISAGASGWRYEWWQPTSEPPPRYRLWWLQDTTYGYRDIPEPTPENDIYVTDFSARENQSRVHGYSQQLDVLAPGSWVRGPLPGLPGYNHLPWWSPGNGWIKAPNLNNFFFSGGTSMSTPHVSGIAALMLEKNLTLNQAQVESIMKKTALSVQPGSMTVWDLLPSQGWYTYSWESNATGAGLIRAYDAVAVVP